jgi:hypothetical protein
VTHPLVGRPMDVPESMQRELFIDESCPNS